MKQSKEKNKKIRDRVVSEILELLKDGVNPWNRPWTAGQSLGDHNAYSGHSYQGINISILAYAKEKNGWQSDQWLTFNNVRKNKGSVIKGSKATRVVFVKTIEFNKKDDDGRVVTDDNGKPVKIYVGYLNEYPIFNIEQTENVRLPKAEQKRIDAAIARELLMQSDAGVQWVDSVYTNLGVDVHHTTESKAYYSPGKDMIHLPNYSMFKKPSGYTATALHELVHWTGAESRNNRPGIVKFEYFGSRSYAFEELIAEIGSVMLGHKYGISGKTENHASYIDGWIKVLESDSQSLFEASHLAEQAMEYISDNTA